MSRVETASLKALIEHAESGQYDLPDAVTAAYQTAVKVQQVTATEPAFPDVHAAGARLIQAVTTGKPVDLASYGLEVWDADTATKAHDLALRVLAAATEQATNAAVSVAADNTETIITTALAPALEELLDQARTAAAALKGVPLEADSVLRAQSPEATAAWFALDNFAARYRVLRNARRWTLQVGNRAPTHDATGLFAEFARPQLFHPGWKAGTRIPPAPAPEDARARMVWLTSPTATEAGLWMPTTAQEDQAWWDVYGEAAENRTTHALAARAHAGQNV